MNRPPPIPSVLPAVAADEAMSDVPSAPSSAPPKGNRVRSTSVGQRDRTRAACHNARIRLGVCARDKKAHSKPMRQILSRFDPRIFEVILFGDDVIDNQPIERWPLVDCLMSWFSNGFPVGKAEAYAKLRKPFCINDLSMEHTLRDRRKFYKVLEEAGIPTPPYIVVDRDTPGRETAVIETDDAIEVNGVRINKPFVEKLQPVNAEDHNIYIYYPRRVGGGSKRLFRKVGNISSKFYPDVSCIRTEGSYIYEEFLMTQGTDIKIYVVGPDYAHAEARKSPVVDGIVARDAEGKEVRFPILLTSKEKDIARRVCLAFRQNVCGFDLLRTPGRSCVCDVNGWSFVKKSHKYYDDAAQLLQLMMIRALAPERIHSSILLHTSPPAGMPQARADMARHALLSRDDGGSVGKSAGSSARGGSFFFETQERPPSRVDDSEDAFSTNLPSMAGPEEELRCVAAIIRHGDRTPKQKMKMVVTHPDFLALHTRFAKRPRDEAKLKSAQQLQAVLEVTRHLIAARLAQPSVPPGARVTEPEHDAEALDRLLQMKAVLEKGGHFSGINRKVQLKPTKWTRSASSQPRPTSCLSSPSASGKAASSLDVGTAFSPTSPSALQPDGFVLDPSFIYVVSPSSAPLRSVPKSAVEAASTDSGEESSGMEVSECLLVLKWGGVLTHAGRQQAEDLGQRFRSIMYPGESVGLLRLHSTYRHDLKIYSSDEGRVQMTAAAFVKGFLDLEGELTPILASLVKTVNTANLLDDSVAAREIIDSLKNRLKQALASQSSITVPPASQDAPEEKSSSSAKGSCRPVDNYSLDLPTTADLLALEKMLDPELIELIAPTKAAALLRGLLAIGSNPKATLHRILALLASLVDQLQDKLRQVDAASPQTCDASPQSATETKQTKHHDSELARMVGREYADASTALLHVSALAQASESCGGESLWLMLERWKKLMKDFYKPKKDTFDLSKIPDIYDQIKYDCLHSASLGLTGLQELHRLASAFADVVVSQEYGITVPEKKDIAARICHHLLRKVFFDMTAVAVEDTLELESSPSNVSVGAVKESPASAQGALTAEHPAAIPVAQTLEVVHPPSTETAPDAASTLDGRGAFAPVLPSAPATGSADVKHVGAIQRAGIDTFNTQKVAPQFISPLTGLVVSFRQHSFAVRLRRKSAPCALHRGMHRSKYATATDMHHSVNPAIGPAPRPWQPLYAAVSSLAAPSSLSRIAGPSPHPTELGSVSGSASIASAVGRNRTARRSITAADEDACETASTVSNYERAVTGPVLVPNFRLRQRPAALGASPIAIGASSVALSELGTAEPSPSASSPSRTLSSKGVEQEMARESPLSAAFLSPPTQIPPAATMAQDGVTDSVATFIHTSGSNVSLSAMEPAISNTPSGSGQSSKISTIMAALAQDMHDVHETVHQLDARLMTDAGYEEIKTPFRHVRTRLYFTSESHVHALINTIKYWAFRAESDAECAAPETRLTSDTSMRMLEATPELDYLTHIVFRLYENFNYPAGHPRRHRIEILFSPGASFSPFDGQPREPRTVFEPTVPVTRNYPASTVPRFSPIPQLALAQPDVGAGDEWLDKGIETMEMSAPSPTDGDNGEDEGRQRVLRRNTSTRFQVPEVLPPSSTVYAGPPAASAADLEAHTLPVAGVVPINISLTLTEFEDVLAEAIYYGAQLHLSEVSEQHPKDEAKARAAAARARKAKSDGYFLR